MVTYYLVSNGLTADINLSNAIEADQINVEQDELSKKKKATETSQIKSLYSNYYAQFFCLS